MKQIKGRHIFAAVVVTSLAINVVSAIVDAATAPEGENAEAVMERHQDALLGVGVIGALIVAQTLFDTVRFVLPK